MNQTDPLAQLNDIHLPEPLMLWVPAFGWWILALCLLAASYWALRKTLQIIANRRYRKIALQELSTLSAEANANDFLIAVNHLLKRTAITAFGHTTCAALKGAEWLTFLDDTMPAKDDSFTQGTGKILAQGQYQAQCDYDAAALQALSLRWIKTHTKAQLKKNQQNKEPNNV